MRNARQPRLLVAQSPYIHYFALASDTENKFYVDHSHWEAYKTASTVQMHGAHAYSAIYSLHVRVLYEHTVHSKHFQALDSISN